MSLDYTGPCRINCPMDCEVPEGVKLSLVPRPRHAWGDVVNCPHGDDGCERSFLVEKVEASPSPAEPTVWDMGDPEPPDVRVVTDDADGEGNCCSDVWNLTTHTEPDMRWKGYKQGTKVYLSWDELTRRWGPLRRADG